jgi:hypothetical protein
MIIKTVKDQTQSLIVLRLKEIVFNAVLKILKIVARQNYFNLENRNSICMMMRHLIITNIKYNHIILTKLLQQKLKMKIKLEEKDLLGITKQLWKVKAKDKS